MASCGGSRGGASGLVLALLLGAAGGCSDRPTTYPVRGKLVFDKGDVKLLEGSTLICQNQEKPLFLIRGDIQEDGSFELETNWKGRILPGAVAGPYRAWLQLSTENSSEERQFRRTGIDPVYLTGRSDLTFQVPAAEEVVLTVTRAPAGAQREAMEVVPALGVRCGEPDEEPEPSADRPD